MIGNGLAMDDVEAAPAFAFGRLEAFEDVEEGERRVGVGDRLVIEGRED